MTPKENLEYSKYNHYLTLPMATNLLVSACDEQAVSEAKQIALCIHIAG